VAAENLAGDDTPRPEIGSTAALLGTPGTRCIPAAGVYPDVDVFFPGAAAGVPVLGEDAPRGTARLPEVVA